MSSLDPTYTEHGSDDGQATRSRSPRAGGVDQQTTDEHTDLETAIDRSPSRTSLAITTGLAAIAAISLPSSLALALGVPGLILVAAGTALGSRRPIDYGAFLILASVVIAGLVGSPPHILILSTLCAVLAWDAGRYGCTLGDQLGREADTTRLEVAHTTLNAIVGVAGVSLGYASYLLAAGEQPVAAVTLVLLGAVILLATLR